LLSLFVAKVHYAVSLAFIKAWGNSYRQKYVLQFTLNYDKICTCENILAFAIKAKAKDHKEVQEMNQYELALVINGKLTEEDRDAALEKVKALVERFEGNIAKVDEWGKRRLAYEIQKVREGFYYFITFESEATAPAQIEKRIRIMEPVLRFLIVRADA